MKKLTLTTMLLTLIFTGCTQVITAPISVAGSVAGAAIDVTAAGVRAVAGDDEEDKDED